MHSGHRTARFCKKKRTDRDGTGGEVEYVFDVPVVIASLLEHYNLGMPADRILYTLTYPQMYYLMDEISKKNEKKTKERSAESNLQSSENVAVVKNFADMWR